MRGSFTLHETSAPWPRGRFCSACSALAVRAAALALVLAGAEGRASAQSSTDRTLAESLFRQGREAMDKGNVADACAKFAESYRLDKALGTQLNLALCHEKEGRVATAWAEFNDAADEAHRDHDDREAFARKHIAALEVELPRVRFVVDPANLASSGIEIRIDGIILGQAAWSALVPVDPGEHVVEATATDKRPWKTKITIVRAASVTNITVPPLQGAPQVRASLPPTHKASDQNSSSGSTQRVLGVIAAGLGVAGLAVGGALGLKAIALKGERDSQCKPNNVCSAEGLSKDDDARTAATLSTIGFVAGGALVVSGAVLYFTAPSGSPIAGAGTVGMAVAPRGAALSVNGTW